MSLNNFENQLFLAIKTQNLILFFLTRPNNFNNLDNICVKNRANDFSTFKKLFKYFKMGLKVLGLNFKEKNFKQFHFPR